MRKIRKHLCLLLAVLLLLSCGGCAVRAPLDPVRDFIFEKVGGLFSRAAGDREETVSTPEPDSGKTPGGKTDAETGDGIALTAANLAPGGEHGNIAYSDLEYYHYNSIDFYRLVNSLKDAAESGDADEVIACYDRAYTEFLVIDTLDALIYMLYSDDIQNEELSDEMLYCDSLWSETGNKFCDTCREILTESSCADALAEHIGEELAEAYINYEALTDRESELSDRESELVTEYYSLMDSIDKIPYRYRGTDWTLEMLNGAEGDELYDSNYDGYLDVYYGIGEEINKQAGPIYLELVQIRDEIAALNGYDNYNDYAYEQQFGRDYTPEDAQKLCDAVKGDVSHAYYGDDIYYSAIWYYEDSVGNSLNEKQLLSLLGRYASEIDGRVYEVWKYMTSLELFDIGDGRGRMESCYSTQFSLLNEPVIYLYTYGTSYDMSSIVHEFGHCVDAYYNPPEEVLFSVGSYDLFEIHSTGMEVLYLPFYDAIFGSDADAARFLSLTELVSCVIDGCIYDEFQRRVYDNPDMTLDEINRLYCDLCAEYGEYEPRDVDYYWMYISHNFERPLYYISYAVSALASLQLWDIQQTNPERARSIWMKLVNYGAYGDGYMTVLPACGLRLFTEKGAVDDICGPVLDYLSDIDRHF